MEESGRITSEKVIINLYFKLVVFAGRIFFFQGVKAYYSVSYYEF